jgi:hypothetical protein
MKLSELAATGGVLSPWPVVIGGRVQSGRTIPISPYCERKCGSSPACHSAKASNGESLCVHGMSYFKFVIADEPITVFGLRSSLSKDTGNKVLKDALKGRSVNLEEIQEWINSVVRLMEAISTDFVARQAEMLSLIHI